MARMRRTKVAGDYARDFFSQDGQHYRKESQDITPAIQRVQEIRDLHSQATRASNPGEWRHVGSIPMTVLIDWLTENKYTFDQWARNEDNSKKKFLSYFLSRDFSKLHNEHVTTRRGNSQIVVPNYIGRDNDPKLPRTEGGGS